MTRRQRKAKFKVIDGGKKDAPELVQLAFYPWELWMILAEMMGAPKKS